MISRLTCCVSLIRARELTTGDEGSRTQQPDGLLPAGDGFLRAGELERDARSEGRVADNVNSVVLDREVETRSHRTFRKAEVGLRHRQTAQVVGGAAIDDSEHAPGLQLEVGGGSAGGPQGEAHLAWAGD